MTPITRKNEDGSVAMVVAGRATKEAKTSYTKNGKEKVEFSIAYGEKKYLNCISLGNTSTTRVASCVETGDIVLIAGTWTDRPYTARDGSEKHWQECKIDFISVQQDVPTDSHEKSGGDSASAKTNDYAVIEDDDEQLPF